VSLISKAAAALRYGRVSRSPNSIVSFEEIPASEASLAMG
jgi:hypothetical protein